MTIPQLRSRLSCARASRSVRRRSRALIGTLVEAREHAQSFTSSRIVLEGIESASLSTRQKGHTSSTISQETEPKTAAKSAPTAPAGPPPTKHLPPPQICHARSMAQPPSWRWLCAHLFSRHDLSALQALYKLSSEIMGVTELADDVYNLLWSAVDGRLSG